MTRQHTSLVQVLSAAARDTGEITPNRVHQTSGYCNERLEVQFNSGSALIVKRARFEWVAERMRASRRAAALLRRRTGVVAPAHLDVDRDTRGRAVEAYWRIPNPTLAEIWPELQDRRRPQALRSWGALLRRVHKVKFPTASPLPETEGTGLAELLDDDLRGRLIPALEETWPASLPVAHRLLSEVPQIAARCADRPTVLLHNDFHMGNVLCERRPRSIRCVGVIDLETAWAGPAEADIALVHMLHGPLFGQSLPNGWGIHFLDGYDAELDPIVLEFFHTRHLLNHGYFAASCGWHDHVRGIERSLQARAHSEIDRRSDSRSHDCMRTSAASV